MEILEGFSFNNEIFIFIFSLIFLANILVYEYNNFRKLFLIAVSISFFFILSNYNVLSLIVLSIIILINYAGGLILKRYKSKIILFIFIIFNICLLFFIKYPFLIKNIQFYIFITGISFFILNNISFLIDSYNDKIFSDIKILDFFLFSVYFPKMLIGPLVRYNDFYLELNHNSSFPNIDVFYYGIFIFMFGLIKKIGADYISMLPLTIYSNPLGYTGFDHLTAMYGYTVYIYLDFSGYSDIAIGMSLLLGIELTKNFNYPYLSNNIIEFWKKWHISLSLWIKDYIYIPLGGNKKGKLTEYLNICIAFFVSGLWHGLGLNFFIWSTLHSVAIIMAKLKSEYLKILNYRIFTFNLVAFAWIFFANNFSNSLISLDKIFFNPSFNDIYSIISNNFKWYFIFLILITGIFFEKKLNLFLNDLFIKSNYLLKAAALFLIIYFMILSKQNTIKPFIYQQF